MRYRTIVVGTDGSETAALALGRAAELAVALGATLHVVSAYKDPTLEAAVHGVFVDLGDWQVALQEETEAMLADAVQPLAAESRKVQIHAVSGHPATAILNVAVDTSADLVVVGNKGMKGARRVLGSVPNTISHQAPCDVLIVHTT